MHAFCVVVDCDGNGKLFIAISIVTICVWKRFGSYKISIFVGAFYVVVCEIVSCDGSGCVDCCNEVLVDAVVDAPFVRGGGIG